MKRDWELIRDILLRVEVHDETSSWTTTDSFEGHDAEVVGYQFTLLLEAGLVDGRESAVIGESYASAYIQRLTWNGHEFLDQIRSDTRWRRILKSVGKGSTDLSFSAIKAFATEFALEAARRAAMGG